MTLFCVTVLQGRADQTGSGVHPGRKDRKVQQVFPAIKVNAAAVAKQVVPVTQARRDPKVPQANAELQDRRVAQVGRVERASVGPRVRRASAAQRATKVVRDTPEKQALLAYPDQEDPSESQDLADHQADPDLMDLRGLRARWASKANRDYQGKRAPRALQDRLASPGNKGHRARKEDQGLTANQASQALTASLDLAVRTAHAVRQAPTVPWDRAASAGVRELVDRRARSDPLDRRAHLPSVTEVTAAEVTVTQDTVIARTATLKFTTTSHLTTKLALTATTMLVPVDWT